MMTTKERFIKALSEYKKHFGEDLPTMELDGNEETIAIFAEECVKNNKPYISTLPDDCFA